MRWVPWVLGVAGVVQHAIIAYLDPVGYVSADMSYLTMWLAVIGALLICYTSSYCCCDDGSCGCCDDGCGCGDCEGCMPNGNGHAHEHGHEGHTH